MRQVPRTPTRWGYTFARAHAEQLAPVLCSLLRQQLAAVVRALRQGAKRRLEAETSFIMDCHFRDAAAQPTAIGREPDTEPCSPPLGAKPFPAHGARVACEAGARLRSSIAQVRVKQVLDGCHQKQRCKQTQKQIDDARASQAGLPPTTATRTGLASTLALAWQPPPRPSPTLPAGVGGATFQVPFASAP